MNRGKTKILSPKATEEGKETVLDMSVVDKVKILGIWIGLDNSEENRYEWNFKQQLKKIQGRCESWAQRCLSLKGKTTVANTLLLSLLQYPMSIIPTPERVTKEYKAIISDFLWDNKRPKVAYKTLIQGVERGGLKLLDIATRIEVNMLQWIRRVLAHPEMNTGKILKYVWHTNNIETFLSYRSPKRGRDPDRFQFYQLMLKTWLRYRDFEPVDEAAICRETIWHNKYVWSCAVMKNQKRWEHMGIVTVGDICHSSEGRLLSHAELADSFHIKCTFLEALGLRLSIPARWRSAITSDWQPEYPPKGLEIQCTLTGCLE